MLNWLFGTKKTEPVLSKVDYWKAFELYALFDDLDKVMAVLEQMDDTRIDFIAFKDWFSEELGELEGANVPDFTRVWLWFSPGAEWDRVTGKQGAELGRSVFKRADWWKRNQDFLPGSIVCLEGEYGVVLGDSEDGLFGLVRWDTDKDQDAEDWRGIWGNFLAMGGKVVEDHEFNFIDRYGNLKRGMETENRDFVAFKEEISWFLKPDSKVVFKEGSLRLSEEFKEVFPILTTLVKKARTSYLSIDGTDYLLLAWDGIDGKICGWLNRLEDPDSYAGGLSAEHELLLRGISGIRENFGLSVPALSDNQEWMFLGSECSLGLGDYDDYYEMMCADEKCGQIDSSDYMVFVVEANGGQVMYERASGSVHMLSHDHCFENVAFLPGQPAYTFHTINGVGTFVDYVEILAGQWMEGIK
ncbi:hypothetical protein DBR40_07205 [Pedobacter sp. KBW01]|uniref:hypothetical protein n=1 Tax=Pedobacter sp. KBW01 TaxID=2153364 RepID=UPI000F5B4629|nr:hypothetical protein [Pedobacter sp. KBW01]RQO77755.1 hypothetical protein DBR40_07205 [Pedobacter sp. KBW01]